MLISAYIVYIFNIYLFIWLHWVLVVSGRLLSCGSPAPQLRLSNSPAHGLLSCDRRAPQLRLQVSLVATCRLLSCGTWAPQLQQAGSLIAAHGLLSCGTWAPQLWHANSQLRHACGIQFPDQGLNQAPCIGSTESYPLCHHGSPCILFMLCKNMLYFIFWATTMCQVFLYIISVNLQNFS